MIPAANIEKTNNPLGSARRTPPPLLGPHVTEAKSSSNSVVEFDAVDPKTGFDKDGSTACDSQCVIRMFDSFDHKGPNGIHLVMVFEV